HGILASLGIREKKQLIMFVGAGNILSHAKKLVGEIAFQEMEQRLTSVGISFTRFADLTNSFSIRIAVSARIYVEPKTLTDLATVLSTCWNLELRYVIVGNGTKLLPPDGVVNAVVIRLRSDNWCNSRWIDDNTLHCPGGVQMRDFCNLVREKRYLGVEKLAYIPCSIGGAIAMNAGSHGQSISDAVVSVEMMAPDGSTFVVGKDKLNFAYRTASVPRNYVVVGAAFRFSERGSDEYFRKISEELLELRKSKQPKGSNFGSVFKNCPEFPAGGLVDRAGLKGYKIGGAAISDIHANFIVNCGNASSMDVEKLIDLARYDVYNKFGKFLQLEVRFLRG
ncbi:MAG: UDP-N-acetylmuramate dehydrogenase, partial [Puniceicoccales bacterium]|nr:UDP-N-acetylmuramate dehydrogenase [Puniceicoccales bacterium]